MKRNKNYEYMNETGLWIKLYAPEGSIFPMPPGGDPITYISRGYKLHADEDWNESNAAYEKANAESIQVSDWDREIKVREIEVGRKKEKARLAKRRTEIEDEMNQAEAGIEAEEREPSKPKPKIKVKAKRRT